MTTPKLNRLPVVCLGLAIAMAAVAGCGGTSVTEELPPPPSPVANPSADNKLKDITLENEAANMDKIKKAGEGR